MKHFLLLLTFLGFACTSMAQIESAGIPTPFPNHTPGGKNMQLKACKEADFPFITLNIDTTQSLPSQKKVNYVGYTQKVAIHPDNDGIWTSDKQGNSIWRVGLISPGAQSMSVVLDSFEIPAGAKIFVYNPKQTQVLGAFMANNHNPQKCLPIRPLAGDSLIVEYQEPATADFSGSLRIAYVAHNRKSGPFGGSQSCSSHANFTPEASICQRGVCFQYTVSLDGSYYSSGSFINNPQGRPYVYTAAHNFSESADEERTVFYFNYAVTAQDSTIQGSEEFSIAGSTLKAKEAIADFALVELNQMPPRDYRPYFLGWTREENPQPPFMCIQHPKGDSKKVSFCWESIRPKTYPDYPSSTLPNGWWYIRRWSKGATEPGSSGSPLLDQNNRIIGALTGGSSSCESPISDYYSRFNLAWDYNIPINQQLQPWLDPYKRDLMSMDGKDPYEESPCSRLTNLPVGGTIKTLHLCAPHSGLLSGHNSKKMTAYAEKFEMEKEGRLYGMYYMPSHGHYSKTCPVRATVYDGVDIPSKCLSITVMHPVDPVFNRKGEKFQTNKKDWNSRENYIRLVEPVEVGKTFFVGYEIDYSSLSPADSFAVLEGIQAKNTSYYKEGNQWYPMSQLGPSISLWIEPVWEAVPTVDIIETLAPSIALYPNPTTGPVYWESTHSTSYKLYNLQGNLIQTGKGNTCYLPVTGIYLLQIQNAKGNWETYKVIRR